ncbi:MAG TPA: sulfate ABC transporter ATP-binding protein [Kiritimatiellia bacterium]|nr:sulfate ABC transporter ATP-binding protein [Kiritimatiellia bacterium]
MTIEAKNITKTFGSFVALNDVSLTVPSGKLVALLGPSGSGKTTLLRIIAGLEQADSGQILMDGNDATDASARDRRVGFVFQHYALFRHMTVFENVAFGLRVKKRAERPSRAEIRSRVLELLKLVQIDWLADRLPNQLSGGQRQRVALARALAVEPKVLLLDEPFGALDAKVRKELRRWLRRLHDEIHVTSVFVTHDVDEALEVADEVVVMNQARIEQVGTPDDVYEHPANSFVYHFLGSVNLFHTRVRDGQVHLGDDVLDVKVDGPEALVHARPHDIEIVRDATHGGWLKATVLRIHAIGPIVRIELLREDDKTISEAELTRERYSALRLIAGENVFFRPRTAKVYDTAKKAEGPHKSAVI